jgi:hypothetical protein
MPASPTEHSPKLLCNGHSKLTPEPASITVYARALLVSHWPVKSDATVKLKLPRRVADCGAAAFPSEVLLTRVPVIKRR